MKTEGETVMRDLFRWFGLSRTPGALKVALTCALLTVCALPAMGQPSCDVTADVVAMDQVITYNRMAAFSPAGMIFALGRDVFPKGTLPQDQILAESCAVVECTPGNVQLRDDKRPRPLTLRVNQGCNITINFTNLLDARKGVLTDAKNEAVDIQLCEPNDGEPRPGHCQSEQPATRATALHVQGMIPVESNMDGSKVGNDDSLVLPGGSRSYTLKGMKEGAYVITSGPNLGGQGGSGAIASGLFGILNVEPDGAVWYRSQTTREEMLMATPAETWTEVFVNEVWDAADIFDDANGNGVWDAAETLLTDADGDGEWDAGDTFDDANGNGVWDAAETLLTDGQNPGVWDDAEPLDDTNGNGIWDAHQRTPGGQPILDYDAVYPTGHAYAGKPILRILDGNATFHNEINAVIAGSDPCVYSDAKGSVCFAGDKEPYQLYPDRKEPFRELSILFHDEIKVVQAFPEWFNQLAFTLGSVKDGFAINYGTGGIGSEIIGNRLGVGPMNECVECKYEEFFLTSWALGDPAMIVDVPANLGLEQCDPALNNCPVGALGPKATRAFYPDDPTNVWHGYLNDRTKVRNIHVGTEHHIFHLHAHQWNFVNLDDEEDQTNYLDAQAIGPGSSFTYEITYGGAGNRTKTPGDSIFHCHFYPHFAQGMWGLWRVHDVFEEGSVIDLDPTSQTFGRVLERGLPDAEICIGLEGGELVPVAGPGLLNENGCGGYTAEGTPIMGGTPVPAVVPLPGIAMAPMPGVMVNPLEDTDSDGVPDSPSETTEVAYQGYPFFIPGVAGHRPPTAPLDLVEDGGLPRHVITSGTAHAVQTATDFDKVLLTAKGFQLPEEGTEAERAAMAFHGPQLPTYEGPHAYHDSYLPDGVESLAENNEGFEINGLPPIAGAPFAEPCRSDGYDTQAGKGDGSAPVGQPIGYPRFYAASVIELDNFDMNKVGWHFGQQRILVLDGDVGVTLAGTRAPEPLVMRANQGDCVDFNHTNLVPSIYQLDDYQVKTPTDVIGQHIHLVKFDVMSADGSANGWNYEDGTFSPHEVQERIHAFNDDLEADPAGGGLRDLAGGAGELHATSFAGDCPGATADQHEGCDGTRTSRQRWYIDPGWSGNIFTHDHFGPSTHQQSGLYATMLVEPKYARWLDPANHDVEFGTRADGGPTSWRADIDCTDCPEYPNDAWREFYLEFGDFQQAYRSAVGDGHGGGPPSSPNFNGPLQAVNPSYRNEVGLPHVLQSKEAALANPTTAIIAGCGKNTSPNPAPYIKDQWTGCAPEAISAADPGTFVVNYRNEPLALRVRDPLTNQQAVGPKGDLSYAYQSRTDRADWRLNVDPSVDCGTASPTFAAPCWPYGQDTPSQGALAGDPFTPMMNVYEGDKVHVRVQVGAHEEGHNFSINGVRWLQNWKSGVSGFRSSQMAGISEYFIFEVPALSRLRGEQEFEDYMYQTGSSVDARWNGTWGFMRAYKRNAEMSLQLETLPNNSDGRVPPGNEGEFTVGVCPQGAPNQTYEIVAVSAEDALPGGTLTYWTDGAGEKLHDPTALLYVYVEDLEAKDLTDDDCYRTQGKRKVLDLTRPGCSVRVRADAPIEPLILRANAGDCVRIELFNKLIEQAIEQVDGVLGEEIYTCPEEGGVVSLAPADPQPVFKPIPGAANYCRFDGTLVSPENVNFDSIPDLDGFNTMPMIVHQFGANEIAPSSEVGLHAQLVSFAMSEGDGMNVGFNNRQTVKVGEPPAEYVWYAGVLEVDAETGNRVAKPVEFGAINLMASDPIKGSNKGLIGAMIVEPMGSEWRCDNGKPNGGECYGGKNPPTTRAAATIKPGPEGQDFDAFRDFVVILQDDVNMRFANGDPVPTVSHEEEPEDSGMKGLNYRTEPIWARVGPGPDIQSNATAVAGVTRQWDYQNAFSSAVHGDPATPVFTAGSTEPIRFRVLKPGGHNRNNVFTLHGHIWSRYPYAKADLDGDYLDDPSAIIDPHNSNNFWHGEQMGHGPTNHINVVPINTCTPAGDYLYRDMVPVHVDNGEWGILRITGQTTCP
jgi:hypothetical protein